MISIFSGPLPLVTLLLVLSAAPPAQAELALAPATDEVALIAQLDGRLLPVAVAARHDGVKLSTHPEVLWVIDLSRTPTTATAVEFSLERNLTLRLEVLDLEGRLVRTLAEGLWAAGQHRLAWQHDSESGDRLVEGLYVVRLVPEARGEWVALAR